MIRRIWAIVSEVEFFAVQKRAKDDGLTMGSALAGLAHLYARGARLDLSECKEHYKRLVTGVDYIKEHRLSEVNEDLVGGKDKR